MYQVWIRGFSLRLSFYLSKRVSLCSRYGFFTIPSLILSHLELSRIELPKLTPSLLMEIVQRLDFLKSVSLNYNPGQNFWNKMEQSSETPTGVGKGLG